MARQPLTPKEQAFVTAYVGPAAGNGAAAAKAAGYKGNGKVLSVQASRLLAKASVKLALDEHRTRVIEEGIPTAREVALRLGAIGMGMVKESRLITGKEGDFIEAEVTMPGTVQVSALKALIDMLGYAAPAKSEVTVQPASPEMEQAVIEYLRMKRNPEEWARFLAWQEAQK